MDQHSSIVGVQSVLAVEYWKQGFDTDKARKSANGTAASGMQMADMAKWDNKTVQTSPTLKSLSKFRTQNKCGAVPRS